MRHAWLARVVVAVTLLLPGLACERRGAQEAPGDEAWRTVLRAAAERVPRAAFSQLRVAPRDTDGRVAPLALRAAVSRLEQEFLVSRTPGPAGRAAVALVVSGQPMACLDALALIPEEARTADVWADQSACELEQGLRDGSALSLARALDASLRSLALDAGHREARRNRTLSLRALGLTPPSTNEPDAPFAFLAQDDDADDGLPRGEAVRREDRLAGAMRDWCDPSRAVADVDADLGREVLMRCVLRAWAERTRAGDAQGAAALAEHAGRLAERLAPVVGDGCFPALVADVTACATAADCGRRAEGWLATAVAATEWDASRQTHAIAAAPAMRRAYPAVDSIAAGYAWLELVSIDRLEARTALAESRTRDVLAFARTASCGHLLGRALWRDALLRFERSDFAGSDASAREGLDLLERTGDREALAVLAGVAAGIHRELEDFETAWGHMRRGLQHLWDARQNRRQSVLQNAAILADRSSARHASLALRAESIADAQRAGAWDSQLFLLTEHASVASGMGLSGLAQRALVDAERALAHVDDAGTRSLALVSYALAFSRTHGPAHYADSRRLLTEALGSQDRRGMTFRLEALRNQLRIEAAEAGDDRVLFGGGRLERADGAGGHGGPVPADVLAQVAQAYWDRGRLDQVRTWALGTVASREADAGRLGRRVLTLRFLPAASKTLVVGSGPAGPIAYAVDAGAERLAGDIRLVQRALSAAHPGRARDQLAAAFTTLLGPARQQLRAATDLVILPGPIVERVPFAALFDVERQRYLIQDVVVHYGSLEPTRRSTGAAAALIVGAGDDAGGGRPRLAEVAREVEQLRQIHAGAAVLRGGADSKGQLLAQLPEAGLFHFAGHAQLNLARADLSRLILGDETSPRAALTAREIAQMHLPRLDVAVLSACSTAGNLALSREGHGGLAAAFLGAGARSVVATLWDVPDNTSRIVTIELHRRLREGAGVGRALQAAQLAALAGHPGGPAGWAAFIAVHR